jgi:hypothetical protein
MVDQEIEEQIREVTADEVDHYRLHGWVKLEGLISSALAGRMLTAVMEAGEQVALNGGSRVWMHPALHGRVEPFRSVAFARRMGRNVQLLMDRRRLAHRDVGVQYRQDIVLGKPPAGADEGTSPTPYHQDSASGGPDRVGGLNVWIALNEVTPDHGGMRFLTGSHREGPLGVASIRGAAHGQVDMLTEYPGLLEQHPISAPLHYLPGDATVHHVNTVHGTGTNRADDTRWSFILSYLPDDVRFDGRPDELNAAADLDGLDQGMPFRHPGAPLVYPQLRFFGRAGAGIASDGLAYDIPPSTRIVCPVTYDDSSEQRKRATAATSWAVPVRPMGTDERISSPKASSPS